MYVFIAHQIYVVGHSRFMNVYYNKIVKNGFYYSLELNRHKRRKYLTFHFGTVNPSFPLLPMEDPPENRDTRCSNSLLNDYR